LRADSTNRPAADAAGRPAPSGPRARSPAPAELNRRQRGSGLGTAPHQATKIGDAFLTYDPNGNTTRECRTQSNDPSCQATADHLRRLFWTEENRLDAVIDGGGESITSFVYDAEGQRIVKLGRGGESVTIGQFWSLKGRRAATKHVFAGAERLASKLLPPPGWDDTPVGPLTDPTTAAVTTLAPNTNGCDPSDYQPQKCPVLPGGDPVLNHRYDGTKVRPETYYYHPDRLGSTNWVTDQKARVHEHVEYFPYGEVWRDTRSDADGAPVKGQRFLFTAKELDEETGFIYFGARYYSAARSRWLSVDPADRLNAGSQPVALDLYQYGAWNPQRFVDADGRLETDQSAPGNGVGGVTGAGSAAMSRVPVPGSGGLGMEFWPRGWTPKGGSSSVLFFQDPKGKAQLRLDLGYNTKTGKVDAHWNQKGTYDFFKIADHTPAPRGLFTGVSALRAAGTGLLVAGVALDGASFVMADDKVREGARIAGGWTGAWAMAKAGGVAGAVAGTAIEPGGGTAIGGLLGAFGGGWLGYKGGEKIGVGLVDAARSNDSIDTQFLVGP
jgi:RHS repeat-associated protein